MRGQGLVVGGLGLMLVGLIVLSPALWLIFDQMFQQVFGIPLVGIVIGGGGIAAPLIMTALGTAGIVGGAWMMSSGSRKRREPPAPLDKPADKAANKTSTGG